MNWPIGTRARRADDLLQRDMADLAADSTQLKRENAALRQKLAAAELALTQANELRGIVLDANSIAAAQIAQLEALARAVKAGATTHPHWPLARWVRFGPMAALLATIKE